MGSHSQILQRGWRKGIGFALTRLFPLWLATATKGETMDPVKATTEKIEGELLHAMKGILGSCVTRRALNSPNDMTVDDILINLHLYERLGTVYEAIKALKGYVGDPRGFQKL
jgi:hypothetical protein